MRCQTLQYATPREAHDRLAGPYAPTAGLIPMPTRTLARPGVSMLAGLPDRDLLTGLGRPAVDHRTLPWHERHRDLPELEELDLGLRL